MTNINEVLKFNGLKCDHCDWEDKTIPYETWSQWVDKFCPKCGENVLTQEDYTQVKELVEAITGAIEKVKNMSPEQLAEAEARAPAELKNVKSIEFSFQKDGTISIGFKHDD